MKLSRTTRAIAAIAAWLAMTNTAVAQEYPSKPIRMVVPVAASGMTDIVARMLGQKLSERVGQPVVIENRVGAGGNIGTEAVVRAAPDGYTLLMAYPGPIVINPSLFRNMSYDPVKELAPVSLIATYPVALAVNPEVQAKTVGELVALARRSPGTMNYGSAGNGTTSHLAMELFLRETGTQMTHVPYKGAAPAMTDLVGGRLQVVFDSLTLIMPQHRAGRIRALAVTGAARSKSYPELPTVAESGWPNFTVEGWYAIMGPVGMPAAVTERLSREFAAIVNDAAVSKTLVDRGLDPLFKGPAELGKLVSTERQVWARVITDSRIKID